MSVKGVSKCEAINLKTEIICTGGCDIIYLSFLSWRRGRPGIGRGFELKAFFHIKHPTPGTF